MKKEKTMAIDVPEEKMRFMFNSNKVKGMGRKTVGDICKFEVSGRLVRMGEPWAEGKKGVDCEVELSEIKYRGSKKVTGGYPKGEDEDENE